MKGIKIGLVLFIIFIFASLAAKKAECQAEEDQIIYTVKSGDSLTKLSKKYGVSAQEIIAANPQSKFTKVCIDEREYVMRTGKEVTLCKRVGYWLKIGRTIVIPKSANMMRRKIAELEAEKKLLEKERNELQQEKERLMSQLAKEKQPAEQKKQAEFTRSESSIIEQIEEIFFLVLCFSLLVILVVLFFHRIRSQKIDSEKKAEIREQQTFVKERREIDQKLNEKKKELDEKEKKIEQELKSIKEQKTVLEKKLKEVEQKEQKIEEQKNDLESRLKIFEAQEKSLINRMCDIDQHEVELAERETKLKEAEKDLAMRHLSLIDQQKAIEEKEKELRKKEEELAKREENLTRKEKELETRKEGVRKEETRKEKDLEIENSHPPPFEDDEAEVTKEIERKIEDRVMEVQAENIKNVEELPDLSAYMNTESGKLKVHCPDCNAALPMSEIDEHFRNFHSEVGDAAQPARQKKEKKKKNY